MENKKVDLAHLFIEGRNLRPDLMNIFTLKNNQLRGAIVNTTIMVNRLNAYQELGILESFVLGQAATALALLTGEMKGDERMVMQTNCSGPLKGYSVEGNAHGKIRGFIRNPGIILDKPLESFDLSPFMGIGFLTVTKYLEKNSKPFTGQVTLESGNVAEDLVAYFDISQQIPSALKLSIQFNKQGKIIGAGGLLIQALPGAKKHLLEKASAKINALPPLGQEFADDKTGEELLTEHFSDMDPKVLTSRPVEFYCPCTKERYSNYLGSLPESEILDIITKGPLPAEILCHNCNSRYLFEEKELREILNKK